MTHLSVAADAVPSVHVPFGIKNRRPIREKTVVVKLSPEIRETERVPIVPLKDLPK